jgi:PAS domain S-box-containing protein
MHDKNDRQPTASTEQETKGLHFRATDILESVSEAFFALDRDWRFTYLNRQAEKLLRRSREELLGRIVWEEFPESAGSVFDLEYRQALADGAPRVFEGFYPHFNAWFQVSAYPVADTLSVFFADITDRKRAEVELRESRQDLQLAQAVAQTGSWRLDVRHNELRWSDEAYRIFGIPKGPPLTYETFLAVIHPADRDLVDQAWQSALRGKTYDIEHRILVAGAVKWVRERAMLEFDAAGVLMGGFGTVQDISERKEREAQVRSVALFPEENPFPVLRAAADGVLLFANRAAAQLLAQWQTRVGAPVPAFVRRALTTALASGERQELIVSCGERELSFALLPLAERDYVNFYGRDVTESRQAEARLQRNLQRFELLARTASELLQASEPEKIVEALCRQVMDHLDCDTFFNFLVDESAGRLHLNACAGIPETTARQLEWLDFGVAVCGCAARDGCRIVAEHIPTTLDERTALIRTLGIRAYACHPLLGPGGKVVGTLSFGTRRRETFSADDLSLMLAVTDQVATAMIRMAGELELRQAKEAAEAANRVKSQFLANMSHEIRTPLSGVMGMLDLVLDSPLETTQRVRLKMAREAADTLLQVIDDILDFSKIEEKKLVFQEIPFGLRACVGSAVDLLRPKAEGKGLALLLDIASEVPDIVAGDPNRLRQVLFNLIGNAVKFTDRGEVVVAVRLDPDAAEGDRLCLLFSVRDTGIGIPADRTDRLFIPFSQVDDSYTRRFGGTGLGLAICKEIVTRMGGEIRVESEEGKGSLFSFTARFSRAGNSLPLPAGDIGFRSTGGGDNRARILLVEDDCMIRDVMQLVLRQKGWEVVPAASAEEGVELWGRGDFDLVIMDIQMPGMDGLEATRIIRQQEPNSAPRIPIIALTAHAMQESYRQCLAAGMDDCLVKPVKIQDLYLMVEKHLQRNCDQEVLSPD